MTRELVDIVESFETLEIPVIPLKGPVLATAAFGDVGLRSYVDLDILCRPANVFTVADRLARRGYEHVFPVDEMPTAAIRQYLTDLKLTRGSDEIVMDVQWRLLERRFPFDLSMEEIWNRAGSVSLGGRTVPSLSAEDSLLFLTVHGAKHRWERLGWIADVAATLENRNLDWAALRERVKETGATRMFGLGLRLARELLGVSVPQGIAHMLRYEHVERLAEAVCGHLFTEEGPASSFIDEQAFQIRGLDRRRDRFRFLWRLLSSPGQPDLRAIALPPQLFGLYRLGRPFRLGLEYGPRLLSRQ